MFTRAVYRQHLRELAREVVSVGSAVWDNAGRASDALLSYDIGLVDDVIAADDRIDEMSRDLEHQAVAVLATEAPVASELAYVASLLRLSYELERCGDLMVNVARTTQRLGAPIPAGPVRDALRDLVEETRGIFEQALAVYSAGETADLDERDDDVDDAYTRLLKHLTEPGVDPRTIIALTIAARCYERMADHAVNLAARGRLLASATLE